MKIRVGDEVLVTSGKDRGKTGRVEKVLPGKNKVQISGVNMYKRHVRSRGPNKPGGIIDIIKPLPIANVALLCPKCKKQTRVGYKADKSGEKYRICRKCQGIIEMKKDKK